ncbi:hypothetical protein [Rhodococcus sp. HS-D2]|uniref:hypothetical protein n=1 Tax=Rhodococcus sp. HS-D2 TaxID=1384636 RepID=UPI0007D96FDE|nr:hypothetical protein [Rhodococcus sp. HS-D2]
MESSLDKPCGYCGSKPIEPHSIGCTPLDWSWEHTEYGAYCEYFGEDKQYVYEMDKRFAGRFNSPAAYMEYTFGSTGQFGDVRQNPDALSYEETARRWEEAGVIIVHPLPDGTVYIFHTFDAT